MKKMISLFQRDYETDRTVRNEVVPGAEWVLSGEGVATRKYDGTCCLVRDGKLYKRYDAKQGKTPPAGFEPAQVSPDLITGHWPGWVPVGDGPDDRWHRDAFDEWSARLRGVPEGAIANGTYELCGPKVQGNPEGFDRHVLVWHGFDEMPDAPRDYEGLRAFLEQADIEGIVWHHPDGRMVKLKKRDFGYKRQKKAA